MPTAVVIMGVAGAGKTTVGRLLAQALGWPFLDADDVHPQQNIEKMTRGEPLTDADRAPWLAFLHDRIHAALEQGESLVLACSALKEAYREALAAGNPGVRFVYLRASHALICERLTSREQHFMGVRLLDSQFATLEEPADALVVGAANKPEEIVEVIREWLERNY